MSSDFNKASPGNEDTTHKQDWEIVPVSDVRLTAEEAEEQFMSFVEQQYPEQLHWLFTEIRKKARDGATKFTVYFHPQQQHTPPFFRQQTLNPPNHVPGGGSNGSQAWIRITSYLGKLGYSVTNSPKSRNTSTIDWSNPRRLHE